MAANPRTPRFFLAGPVMPRALARGLPAKPANVPDAFRASAASLTPAP